MRRDTFLKSLAALAAAGSLPLAGHAAGNNFKVLVPANPGGGWDTTGRALGKALQEAKVADTVTYDNKGGAAGAIGLAQFVNGSKGDPNALMVMGAVMLGGIITGKPPVSFTQATPIARITSEYNVFVLPSNSPFKTMKDVVEQLKKDPGSVKWGGGSRGSTEHIAAAMIARAVGVDASKINYVAFRGGGEATAAILGGNVTVGGSGYSEFSEYIAANKLAQPVIVGHSLGGFLALKLAADHPEQVGRLVIVDSLPALAAIQMPSITGPQMKEMAAGMRTRMLGMDAATYKAGQLQTLRTMITGADDVQRALAWGRQSDRTTVANAMAELMGEDLRQEVARIKAPTLVLGSWIAYQNFGSKEQFLQAYQGQYSKLAGVKVEMADNARHFIMLDDPRWMYDRIDQFLN